MEKPVELVFGLVGAIGANLEAVQDGLIESLASCGYSGIVIKLSDLLRDLPGDFENLPPRNTPEYYDEAMKAGNRLRETLGRPDSMAAMAILAIRRRRSTDRGKDGQEKIAYILNSLKRGEEIELLRRIYGPSVYIISAYAPRSARVTRLAGTLAKSQHKNQSNSMRSEAEQLILRDEREDTIKFGQDVRKAYSQADLFVNTKFLSEIRNSTRRFVELLFGHPFISPTADEQGMAFAVLASLRSASAGRQVGAAISEVSGRIISTGCNEVSRAHGGQYWEGDTDDQRDFQYETQDVSDRMRSNLLAEVLVKLGDLELLRADCPPVKELTSQDSASFGTLRKAQIFDTIDFVRAVHAEAAALLSANTVVTGCTLYATTFPCHECARHIVFAGISRVVYVEPYPKSLVSDLFRDSIEVDPDDLSSRKVHFVPFQGVAPSVYSTLFTMSSKESRKAADGTIRKWIASVSFPHLPPAYSQEAVGVSESSEIIKFSQQLTMKGLADGDDQDRGSF